MLEARYPGDVNRQGSPSSLNIARPADGEGAGRGLGGEEVAGGRHCRRRVGGISGPNSAACLCENRSSFYREKMRIKFIRQNDSRERAGA